MLPPFLKDIVLFPKLKNEDRYVCHQNKIEQRDAKNPYEKRSVFKPKVRYSYICVVEDKKTSSRSTRYVFPSPRKSVFKKYGHYKYTPRPASPKDFSPKPKMVNRYVFHLKRSTRYVFPSPTPRKSVFKRYGHYKYTPRPASPKDFSPKGSKLLPKFKLKVLRYWGY